jgi:hypothetical protein
MKLVYWMISASILSALILTILLGADIRTAIWLGMLGPLASAAASWIAMERQQARHPRGMTRLLIKAFAVKMVFFAIYITVLLSLKLVQPVSFIISFACYYLSLHIMEAIGLRRLQTAGHPASQEFFETS